MLCSAVMADIDVRIAVPHDDEDQDEDAWDSDELIEGADEDHVALGTITSELGPGQGGGGFSNMGGGGSLTWGGFITMGGGVSFYCLLYGCNPYSKLLQKAPCFKV